MDSSIALTSRWLVRDGYEARVRSALVELADAIQAQEPGTLSFVAHVPFVGEARLTSMPSPVPGTVILFERYASPADFIAHLNGPLLARFLEDHGGCFASVDGKPYSTVQFLSRIAGFLVRESAGEAMIGGTAVNRSPAVMFELIARDQAKLAAFYAKAFGWTYQKGSSGFEYIHFPVGAPPLLGGIGQAQAGVAGFEPGHNFYLLVDHAEIALSAITAAGGTVLMAPADADGYRFAMFRDPEGNPIGLIEPFAQ